MGHILRKQKEKNIKFFQDCPQSLCSPFEIPHCLPLPQNQAPQSLKIGEWLVAQKWITQDQLIVALKEQVRRSKRLGELLVDLGFLSDSQLLTALSTLSGFPFISLENQILDLTLVRKVPLEVALRYQVMLFQQDEQGAHLAMSDPEDLLALDKVRQILGREVPLLPYHTTTNEIAQAREIYYPQPTLEPHEGEVIQLIHDMILEAVRLKASDIHLSPTAHQIDVHYRQDGILYVAHTLHKERWSAISVRLKIMGGLDIAESRRPQNGRFSLVFGGREIDFRLSCHPTIHGENLVLRILDKTQSLRALDELGFEKNDIKILKELVQRPQGMILLSGPTGSGKTTTLYALLNHMDSLTRNIMTLEEPVEYYVPHIRQTEIREGGPFRFGEGVRSLLRQDPDVIFISEIRDAETAQMALRAAMTGHLVLGTIHAKDCYTIPQRLLDLGVPSSLLEGNLIAGIAQRLVRRLCEKCCYPQIITREDRKRFSLPRSVSHVYQAGSCSSCCETGYLGREAVVESVLFNEEFFTFKSENSVHCLSEKISKNQKVSTLWDRGMEKVLAGKTTFAEIDRVIGVNI
jgi:type II secretory ATPase GspE/PulE/Tfp pilus assembly ATPase PilB-like protein